MRIDERRVSKDKATLWRTMLSKGPKHPTERNGIIVETPDESANGSIPKGALADVDRDVKNLVV